MSSSGFSRLRLAAAVSLVYDASVGVVLIAGRPTFSRIFDVPLALPPIYADLNGIFLLAVAAGYTITYRQPASSAGRLYLWLMGPFLKSAGALAFVLDYLLRGSPRSFLLFAAGDGSIAFLSLWALVTTSREAAA